MAQRVAPPADATAQTLSRAKSRARRCGGVVRGGARTWSQPAVNTPENATARREVVGWQHVAEGLVQLRVRQ